MPETTKMHVYKEGHDLVKDYAVKVSKELGVKVSEVQAHMMLLKLGYKTATGKEYKSKRKD